MEVRPPQRTQESLEFPEIEDFGLVILPHDPPQESLNQKYTDQSGNEVIIVSPEDSLPLPEIKDQVISPE